jgi:hypothetical protein
MADGVKMTVPMPPMTIAPAPPTSSSNPQRKPPQFCFVVPLA